MSETRFCQGCGVQLRPDFAADGLYLCGACKTLARNEAGTARPTDAGAPVIAWAAVGTAILAGAGWALWYFWHLASGID